MRTNKALNSSRVAIAWKNVRANRWLRPIDMINGFKMVQPLSGLNASPLPSPAIRQVLYDVFTRLQITYEPQPVHPGIVLSSRQMSFRSMSDLRVGLFADAPDHLSGVCKTLGEWKQQADLAGRELLIHGCGSQASDHNVVSFNPMGSISLDAYEGLKLNIPRVEDVLEYVGRMAFDVIHISTPGPMGLLGLLAARQYGIPVCGTYHTDFPRYAAELSGNPDFEKIGWSFMRWFYGQLDRVAAPTSSIRDELTVNGLDGDRIHVVGRGVDTAEFNPRFRDHAWRAKHGSKHPVKLLYVGRVSREKNLQDLVSAFIKLRKTRPDTCLVVVGDGPYMDEMKSLLKGYPVCFTGILKGRALSKVYASSDVFVFPSKTDTFGRVVLEAQASGLPVIVSDQGGPKDAMDDGRTGMVVKDFSAEKLSESIDGLTDSPSRMVECGRAALQYAAERTHEASFRAFWDLHHFAHRKQPVCRRERVRV